MNINNKNYTIRPLMKKDGDLLKYWGTFDDPLYFGYEYNCLTEKELAIWYLMKRKINRSEYFSVISKENNLIGYIGIKDINPIFKKAKLGIVLDPNFVSRGIGTMILADFLEYYFLDKKFNLLELEVNSWNLRAIKLYKKYGFKITNTEYIKFENQDIDIFDEKYRNLSDDFKEFNGYIFSKIYKMNLEKKEYLNEIRNRK